MHVHRACGLGTACAVGCDCILKPVLKPIGISLWDGLCAQGCMEQPTATVALVDSGALHYFMAVQLVAEFRLPT